MNLKRTFLKNIKNDFYNVVIGKRTLIIVNYDIDAICASKIIQSLFKYDHMLYSVVPVMGIAGLERAFNENKDVNHVFLINCGGTVDIVELLQPKEDITFFICDSHRPFDICNIYSAKQVCILANPEAEESIPQFETIFRDSDVESNEESSDGEDEISRVERFDREEKRVLKQRERRKWEEERHRVMFEYSQYSYYGRSASLTIFQLAWKLSKDSLDLLWWSIVGTTEQLLLGKIESSTYTLEIENIQSHLSRLTHQANDQSSHSASKINFENDLHLVLYRHWSVQESMRYSMYCACKLKLWTVRGEKKLHELLLEMGLPLIQAKQTFSSMDLVLRQEFFQMVEKLAEKYGIPDIVYSSFTLHYGYRNRFSAADYVYAMIAILESSKKNKTPEDCFLEALDSLSRNNKSILLNGLESAKQLFSAIFKQVQSSLEMRQIHSAGPFLYYIMNEENAFFSNPYGITLLAKFVLHAYASVSRNSRAPRLPLVASCPIDIERGLCLIIGIPPIREDTSKNFFGKAFEQAAARSDSIIRQDFFDSSLIQIRQSDITKFLDTLTAILSF